MFTIIGGDGKEYGPISAEDLRQWIAEGRLNAHSQVKAEGDTEFRPLEKFPDFADAFAPSEPAASLRPESADDFNARDYELDLVGCLTQGWNLVKEHFGILFVTFLVMMLIAGVLPGILAAVLSVVIPKSLMAAAWFSTGFKIALSAVTAVVLGPLAGGVNLVYLKTLRGQPAQVSDMFAGFQASFSQLFLGNLVVTLVTGLCMVPYTYVNAKNLEPLLAQMQKVQPTEVQNLLPQIMNALVSSLPLLFICLIPVTYLTVNWVFTQALIIDKEMDFGTAMRTSWNRVHKHWWQVFGLVVITGLLILVGGLACCVGLVLTGPVSLAALMIGYETIFGPKKN